MLLIVLEIPCPNLLSWILSLLAERDAAKQDQHGITRIVDTLSTSFVSSQDRSKPITGAREERAEVTLALLVVHMDFSAHCWVQEDQGF